MASGSGWNLWVWLLGVVVRRYIVFLILLLPTPLVAICSFLSSIPNFCSFKKKNLLWFQYIFVIKFYVLNNFPHSINTHINNYGRPTAAI